MNFCRIPPHSVIRSAGSPCPLRWPFRVTLSDGGRPPGPLGAEVVASSGVARCRRAGHAYLAPASSTSNINAPMPMPQCQFPNHITQSLRTCLPCLPMC
eukprot:14288353-Alexandrium_andersonii.AAC.1